MGWEGTAAEIRAIRPFHWALNERGKLPASSAYLHALQMSAIPSFDSKGGSEPHVEVRGGRAGCFTES